MKIFKYILILVVVGALIFVVYDRLTGNNIEETPSPATPGTVEGNVEAYLRETISTLSPVEASLGGTWYVVSVEIDAGNNSGTVVYEDGHNQEKRNFTFTTDEEGGILTLKIE